MNEQEQETQIVIHSPKYGVLYFPNGEVETAPGVFKSHYEIAKGMLENLEEGKTLLLPNERDYADNLFWRYEPPGNPVDIFYHSPSGIPPLLGAIVAALAALAGVGVGVMLK